MQNPSADLHKVNNCCTFSLKLFHYLRVSGCMMCSRMVEIRRIGKEENFQFHHGITKIKLLLVLFLYNKPVLLPLNSVAILFLSWDLLLWLTDRSKKKIRPRQVIITQPDSCCLHFDEYNRNFQFSFSACICFYAMDDDLQMLPFLSI